MGPEHAKRKAVLHGEVDEARRAFDDDAWPDTCTSERGPQLLDPGSQREPMTTAHNKQETPLFAASIEKHALRSINQARS